MIRSQSYSNITAVKLDKFRVNDHKFKSPVNDIEEAEGLEKKGTQGLGFCNKKFQKTKVKPRSKTLVSSMTQDKAVGTKAYKINELSYEDINRQDNNLGDQGSHSNDESRDHTPKFNQPKNQMDSD
tara:strand:- start:12 stop:389 length:378 start_codon:yes stop_codon:yes gene_type:complete